MGSCQGGELHRGSQLRIPRVYKFILKWLAPLYLLTIFFFFCKNNLPAWVAEVADDPLRQGAIALILAVIGLLLVLLHMGEQRVAALGNRYR